MSLAPRRGSRFNRLVVSTSRRRFRTVLSAATLVVTAAFGFAGCRDGGRASEAVAAWGTEEDPVFAEAARRQVELGAAELLRELALAEDEARTGLPRGARQQLEQAGTYAPR